MLKVNYSMSFKLPVHLVKSKQFSNQYITTQIIIKKYYVFMEFPLECRMLVTCFNWYFVTTLYIFGTRFIIGNIVYICEVFYIWEHCLYMWEDVLYICKHVLYVRISTYIYGNFSYIWIVVLYLTSMSYIIFGECNFVRFRASYVIPFVALFAPLICSSR